MIKRLEEAETQIAKIKDKDTLLKNTNINMCCHICSVYLMGWLELTIFFLTLPPSLSLAHKHTTKIRGQRIECLNSDIFCVLFLFLEVREKSCIWMYEVMFYVQVDLCFFQSTSYWWTCTLHLQNKTIVWMNNKEADVLELMLTSILIAPYL